jgi:two-component system sensor histidine kinase CreC
MLDADRARFAGNIVREAQRIQELVNRMMELTVLESRHQLQTLAPVLLRPMLDEVAQSLHASGVARGLQVQVAPPSADEAREGELTVAGDAFLLRRALTNLIDNAMDFSPPGGVITLALQRGRRSVDITVRDQGPGLPVYAEGKVFEKFYSLPRPGSNRRSTGLGLAFVKEIAELHNGRAALKNADEGGALATLTLPLSASLGDPRR